MWVHGNATEHMYEDVYKGITTGNGTAYTNPNPYTQEIMSYDNAHEAAKAYYNATEYNFYHSEVIKQNPKLFNNAWFEFWGIERN